MASMRLAEILPVLESIAPLRLAESWDNVGLLVGDPAAEVRAALVCIDYTPAVAAEARAKNAELVVAYHPPIFEPLRRVVAKGPIFEAIRDGVATTRADHTRSKDPWAVPVTSPSTYPRVWLGVPYLGYLFVMDGGWLLLAAAALAAFVLTLATGRRTPLKVVGHPRTHVPVA